MFATDKRVYVATKNLRFDRILYSIVIFNLKATINHFIQKYDSERCKKHYDIILKIFTIQLI